MSVSLARILSDVVTIDSISLISSQHTGLGHYVEFFHLSFMNSSLIGVKRCGKDFLTNGY